MVDQAVCLKSARARFDTVAVSGCELLIGACPNVEELIHAHVWSMESPQRRILQLQESHMRAEPTDALPRDRHHSSTPQDRAPQPSRRLSVPPAAERELPRKRSRRGADDDSEDEYLPEGPPRSNAKRKVRT